MTELIDWNVPAVYIVMAPDARGGIIYTFTDKEEALKRARWIGGIVAMAPIVYRAEEK